MSNLYKSLHLLKLTDIYRVFQKMSTNYIHLLQEFGIPHHHEQFRDADLLLERWCTSSFYRDVRTHLDKNMQNRWFERGDTVRYLPSSPDLTPVNFFVEWF